MKSRFSLTMVLCALLAALTACGGAQLEPLAFNSAPWADGEVSSYALKDAAGAALGTASWTWGRGADGETWTQSYELTIGGRLDHGAVTMGSDLRPINAWREMSGVRFETTYSPEAITILTTQADGSKTTKTLKPVTDGYDNDQSLQIQRALPFAAGYATRYTDVIPTTGLTAGVKVSVTGAETITVPAGTFATWKVALDFGSGKHDAWYGQQLPHPLVKYRNRASGAVFELSSLSAGSGAATPNSEAIAPQIATPGSQQAGPPGLNVPFILVSVLIQYPIMILAPVALGWWLRRRFKVGWGVFFAGVGTFILSQIVHLPLNYALGLLGGGRGVALWPLIPMALIAGLSAGLCEEGARWIVLRFFLKRVRRWHEGLQYGAGHGGAEAIISGVLVAVTLVQMIAMRSMNLSTLGLSEAMASQAQAQIAAYWATPWYMAAVAAAERIFAVTAQIAFALLVVRSVARRQPLYLLAAIGFHAALDAWAVWAGKTLGWARTEAGVAVLAAAALWLIFKLREPLPAAEGAAAPEVAPALTAADLAPHAVSAEELARRADASRYE